MEMLYCMSRTKLIKYIKNTHGNIDLTHRRPLDDLIADVAKEEYSKRSLKFVELLETLPYVILPAFNLTISSDKTVFNKFKQYALQLDFKKIGNESFTDITSDSDFYRLALHPTSIADKSFPLSLLLHKCVKRWEHKQTPAHNMGRED